MQDKGYEQINVSCETGAGIEDLVDALCAKVGFHPPENSLIARTRHLDALRRTASYLSEAHEQLIVFKAGELVAESLRQAQGSLGEITGEFSADDLLGKIFGSFCIGK
jgi:tRNA modification GTPase